MKTTNVMRLGGWRLVLCAVTFLAVLCLVIGVWIYALPKTPGIEEPAKAPQQPQASKHSTGKVHFDLLAKLLADDRRSTPASDWLHELADPKATFLVKTQPHPLLHRPAPHFILYDHRDQPWKLQGQLDRGPVVLVFYLGYACNFCVHDLFELNADVERFRSLGGDVVAVSADASSLTRKRFEEFGPFKYTVLSDPGHTVALPYGTFRPATTSEPEEVLHGTFLIGRDGLVHWVSCGDAPFRNNKALLYELARLENKLPPSPRPTTSGKEQEAP